MGVGLEIRGSVAWRGLEPLFWMCLRGCLLDGVGYGMSEGILLLFGHSCYSMGCCCFIGGVAVNVWRDSWL